MPRPDGPPSPYNDMDNKLSQWIGRALLLLFLLSLTAVLAFSCWKHLSFRAILSGLLRPDWSEVVSITSYRTHDGVYTEYTADNGREQAERMLESVDLGLLPSLRGNSIDRICAGCTVVELTMADGERRRIAFYGGASGCVLGQREWPVSYRCPALPELLAADLERAERSIFLVTPSPGAYGEPRYRPPLFSPAGEK